MLRSRNFRRTLINAYQSDLPSREINPSGEKIGQSTVEGRHKKKRQLTFAWLGITCLFLMPVAILFVMLFG